MDKTNNTSETSKTNPKQEKLSKKENFLQTLKFVLFSASAGLIQIVSFTILSTFVFKDADNEYGWSYFIALILSVLWNFTLNRQFTFKSAKNIPIAMLLVALFYLVFTPLSTWGGQVLSNHGWNEFLILAITMILNMVLEFLYCKFVVYRNSINTNKLAQKQRQKIKNK